MAVGGKKKAAAPSDFKHIKAKVGRRAPRPANVTETSFKAASLAVRSQSIHRQAENDRRSSKQNKSQLSALELFSSRGLSLHQLTSQFQHPAAAVRVSAVRGIADVVKNADAIFLEAHLSSLSPAVAKSVVDEDDTARSLGLNVLKELLKRCRADVIRSFVPLMTAYITSALHSLDRDTRLDGCRAVEIVSTAIPRLVSVYATKLIPAYIGLLSDHASTRGRQSNSKATESQNRKKRRKTDIEPRAGSRNTVLQSLASLLRTFPERNKEVRQGGWSTMMEKADLVFDVTGSKPNGLFISGLGDVQRRVPEACFGSLAAVYGKDGAGPTVLVRAIAADEELGSGVTDDLMCKLRDILVELMQRGYSDASRGLVLSSSEAEELSLLVSCIQGVWQYCLRTPLSTKEWRKIALNLQSLLMESYPVQCKHANGSAEHDTLNANLSVLLIDMGGSTQPSHGSIQWIDPILDYVVRRLEKGASHLGDAKDSNVTPGIILDVISRLVMFQHDLNTFTLNLTRRFAILKRVRNVYFAFDTVEEGKALARSIAGRKAVALLRDVLALDDYDVLSGNTESLAPITRRMLKRLPKYLHAWAHDYLEESDMAITILHSVVRRWNVDALMSNSLATHIREALSPLFVTSKKSKKTKRYGDAVSQMPPNSIFETYPEHSQRMLVGLVSMLQSPPVDTVNGLSSICANPKTSHSLATNILESMHSIRRTMSMQTYLGFAMNSILLENGGDHSTADEQGTPLRHSDDSIQSVSQVLLLCGSQKVLPMIGALLEQWMDLLTEDSPVDLQGRRRAQFRAASCISVTLIRDIQASLVDDNLSSFALAPSIAAALISSTCALLASRSTSDQEPFTHERLITPFMVLMRHDETVVQAFVAKSMSRICDPSEDRSRKMNILTALHSMIHHEASLRRYASQISTCCDSIEKSVDDGAIRSKVSELRTSSQVLCGSTTPPASSTDD